MPVPIFRDNIEGIRKSLIKRFATMAELTKEYKLGISVYDEYKKWLIQMLTAFVANYVDNRKSKHYLVTKDVNFGFTYDEVKDEYVDMVQTLPFKRLIIEIHQQVLLSKHIELTEPTVSAAGLQMMMNYFVIKSIEYFRRVKQHMDNVYPRRMLIKADDYSTVSEQWFAPV